MATTLWDKFKGAIRWAVGTDNAGVAVVEASLKDDARTIYGLESSPAGPSVVDYQPAGDAGVALDDADEAAVLVELNADARRRTTLVDVATLADSEAYGLTVDGASDTRTSDADATEAEVRELMRELVAGLSKPVWATVEDVDGDGSDEVRIEELWSKFTIDTVAGDTDYVVDVTYRDGWTTTTETVTHTSASSGADRGSIARGLRDALDAADAPIEAKAEDGDSDGTDDVVGATPSGETDISFSAGSNVTQDASHSSDPRGDLSVSDNSTGTNADLRVTQEATSATFTVWARHRSGAWVRINNLSGRQITANWNEVLGSLGNYDRLYVEFTSVDGRVGARVAPAIGGQ